MKYLDELVKQSLKKVKTVEERTVLRHLQMNELAQLTEKIADNIAQITQKVEANYIGNIVDHTIYTLPINTHEHKLYNELFQHYDGSDLTFDIQLNHEHIKVRQIYVHLPYNQLSEFTNMKFQGIIEKNGEIIHIPIIIKKEEKYLAREKALFELFQLNKIKWHVPYTPYSRRFFGIYITDIPENITIHDLTNMVIDYGSYQSNIYENYYLVCNIQDRKVITEKNIVQQIGDNIWEYKVFTQSETANYIDCKDIEVYSIKQEGNICVIQTNKPPIKEWKLWFIKSIIKNEPLQNLSFQPLGNNQKINIMSAMRSKNLMRKRSESEIYALCNSYTEFKTTQVKKVKLNGYVEQWFSGYDCHKVFNDTCDIPRKRTDKLYIYFRYDVNNIFAFDEISFLLSVIQAHYPEYEVRGVTEWI